MLLTDPPYNVAYEGKAGKIENDNMGETEFLDFLTAAFSAAAVNMKPGAPFYIWYACAEDLCFRQACKNANLSIRQTLVWEKNRAVLGRQDFQWQHEPCLYGWKEGAAHKWYKKRKEKTILKFDSPAKSKEHPTMKPIELFDYQMQCSSQAGDIVLDLFAGSGTTIMAAEQNGRTAYCMEYDPKYVDVIIRRWENFTGQKAQKISG